MTTQVEEAEVKMATPEEIKEMTRRAFSNSPNTRSSAANLPAKKPEEAITPPSPGPDVKKPEDQQTHTEAKPTTPINYETLSDEERDEMIAKLTGGKVKKIKDLTEDKVEDTEEQKAEKALVKKQKSLEYALATGKVKQSEYDTAVLVKGKTNRDIALDLFTQDAREDNPKITDEEAAELFKDHYMEESEDSDPRRKLRIKEMNRTADRYRLEMTKGIDGMEAEFDSYQTGERRFSSYTQQVDSVFDSLEKTRNISFSYPGPNNTTIDVEIPYVIEDADIKALKRNIRSNNVFKALGGDQNDLKDKDILGAIEYDLSANIFSKVMSDVAIKAAEKGRMDAEAYYKAIPVRTSDNLGVKTPVAKPKIEISEEARARFPKPGFRRN